MRANLKGKPLTDAQIKGHIAEQLSDQLKREFEDVENLTEYATAHHDFIANYILVEIIEKANITLQVKPQYTVEEFEICASQVQTLRSLRHTILRRHEERTPSRL